MLAAMADFDFEWMRAEMVERQIRGRGITDAAVIGALLAVPRELFVEPEYQRWAYADRPLPIAAGQTISQPYIVALMAQALNLQPEDRVLEIGTGSGYAAAVLSRLVHAVYSVERHPELVAFACANLAAAGFASVHVRLDDGTHGWAEQAPFDAIVVAAGGPHVPGPLKTQLAPNGRLVMPVGRTTRRQTLIRLTRRADDSFRRENLGAVAFVPLIGEAGWTEADDQAAS